MDFLDRLQKAALDDCRLDPSRPLLVGVSGGPDSFCLMDGLHRLGFNLVVAHFDHHLRPESGQDSRQVQQMAAERGLLFELDGLDVHEFARREHYSIEEAARTARYRFLFGVARRVGAQAVATGHTADDQVETVLMHLLRGAGLSGLKGMLPRSLLEGWDDEIPLARPLLSVWRDDTVGYCREHELAALTDQTNFDRTYFRNRLRHELIPSLAGYNPQVKEGLVRMARSLAGDAEIVESAVQHAWLECRINTGDGYVELALSELQSLPRGLRRGVLRRAIAWLRPGLRDIDFEMVERAVEFMSRPSRSQRMDLAQGICLTLEHGRIFLAEECSLPLELDWPQLAVDEILQLDAPGSALMRSGWTFTAEQLSRSLVDEAAVREAGRWEAWLDADALVLPLQVRAARPGERFQPLGLGGRSQKFSDFWLNAGLNRRARAAWPLVFSGQQVVWAPGYRPADPARVTEKTVCLVHVRLLRETA